MTALTVAAVVGRIGAQQVWASMPGALGWALIATGLVLTVILGLAWLDRRERHAAAPEPEPEPEEPQHDPEADERLAAASPDDCPWCNDRGVIDSTRCDCVWSCSRPYCKAPKEPADA